MKALTLTQPWATLVAIGAKQIETRCWTTAYRGPIAIHAAKKFPIEALDLSAEHPFRCALERSGIRSAGDLPLGQIIAVAEIDSVWSFIPSSEAYIRKLSRDGDLPMFEADFGDYSHRRYGFLLKDVRPLATPIPARGMLGLWDVPPDVLALICAQTDEEHLTPEPVP